LILQNVSGTVTTIGGSRLVTKLALTDRCSFTTFLPLGLLSFPKGGVVKRQPMKPVEMVTVIKSLANKTVFTLLGS
jgi:hypothetical protein